VYVVVVGGGTRRAGRVGPQGGATTSHEAHQLELDVLLPSPLTPPVLGVRLNGSRSWHMSLFPHRVVSSGRCMGTTASDVEWCMYPRWHGMYCDAWWDARWRLAS
jgi:hypothetical protein